MPKYYGCPCEGCGEPLTLRDDIVVCPDCGAPYHRSCYDKLGLCVHNAAHAAGYEWNFPYQDAELRTCPSCGERTLRSESVCRCCGAALPPETAEQPNDRAAAESEQEGAFDYAGLYRRHQAGGGFAGGAAQPGGGAAAFGKEQTLDGISCADWLAYLGPSGPVYLETYRRMQLQNSKISMSLSALLFGPFYFFYRKAWKPAFAFLAAELVLMIPSMLELMQLSGSALAPSLSDGTLTLLFRLTSVLSFVLMAVRGIFGKWFYRQSAAAQIRRIQSEFPDPGQRRAVLAAQGGVSFAAVFGAALLMMVLGSAFTLLLGPNLDAVVRLLYG